MQQRQAPWYLFDSSMREVSSTNIILEHLPSKTTGKKPIAEEALLNFFDRSEI